MKTVAFIPIRGGSKSIPDKNIKLLKGKPLIYWSAKAASDCKYIDEVYISTDSEKIRQVVLSLALPKVKVIDRSKETASDTATSESALLEFCNKVNSEIVTFIQATSPLLTATDLDRALEKYKTSNFDSLLSVVKQERFFWEESDDKSAKPINYNPQNRPRRQDFSGQLVENGAFYISKKESILSSNCRISGKIGVVEMSPRSYFEIDEPSDWNIIENLMEKTVLEKQAYKIKLFITDVDGVLTDAGMYYSESGDELKKFNTRDGKGIELLRNANIKTAIITSEDTKIVSKRAEKLKIDYLFQGEKNKLDKVKELCEKLQISLNEVAYIGDDINDLEPLKACGLTASPADAMQEVKKCVDIVCQKRGGFGCVREFAEIILLN